MNIDDILNPPAAPTDAQKRAALDIVFTVAELIRTLGSVPSGVLYARVMHVLSLHAYERIVETLKDAQLVEEKHHVLRWVGPTLSDAKQL